MASMESDGVDGAERGGCSKKADFFEGIKLLTDLAVSGKKGKATFEVPFKSAEITPQEFDNIHDSIVAVVGVVQRVASLRRGRGVPMLVVGEWGLSENGHALVATITVGG